MIQKKYSIKIPQNNITVLYCEKKKNYNIIGPLKKNFKTKS
jgi:hypothetical protein